MSGEEEGAVKIAVRERPLVRKNDENHESIVTYHSTSKNIIIVNERPYEFDYCLGPDVCQKALYDDLVKPMVQKTLQGYFCTALAYGQTGTGKTFTMGLHSEFFDGQLEGVIPRSLRDVFRLSEGDMQPPEIAVSFVEIYSEKVYDLLAEDTNEQANVKGFKFGGGIKRVITNAHEGLDVLMQGNKCRHIRPTKMNPESSRSHAIFTIHVSRPTEVPQINSLLHLVDLAGSEGVRRTGHQGVALAEGVHINKGLLSIGKVLKALADKNKVIPYRDSVLSSVLQDSLNSNSYLTMLACISPFQEDLSETVSTLRFAASAKTLKHNPQINSILMEIKKNKMKTPLKGFAQPLRPNNSKTPTPLKRAFTSSIDGPLSAIKKPMHSNTFCTPNKMKKMTDVRPLNQTAIGLTPKEKMKFNGFNEKFNALPIDLPMSRQRLQNPNESIDSRSSLMSMNVSTSTAVDAPAMPVTTSYSPIVRRCVDELKSSLENKMDKMFDFMREMQTSRMDTVYIPDKNVLSNETACTNGLFWPSKKEFQNIVREEILSMTSNINPSKSTHGRDTILEDDIHHEQQPFAQSSPIFKMPAPPPLDTTEQIPHNETVKINLQRKDHASDTMYFQESRMEDSTLENETVVAATRTRRTLFSECSPEKARPVRRSLRLDQRSSTMIVPSDDQSILQNSGVLSLTLNRPKERRSSVRRSMRIHSRNSIMPVVEEVVEVAKVATKRIGRTVPVHNKTIAQYFSNQTNALNKTKTKKQAKDAQLKHEKAILDLLNTGTIREIQILPQVGLKTAYQIITQRTLNGKFKNFSQISKLPVWRGKAWDRFKQANSIL